MKICSKCSLSKENSEFPKKGNQCKVCVAAAQKERDRKRYLNQKQTILEANKQYRETHKEERRAYQKEWYEDNIEDRKAYLKSYNKEYSEIHAEEIKEKNSKNYEDNKDERKAYQKLRYENNRDNINEYYRFRYETDPVFKMKKIISKLVDDQLKSVGSTKHGESFLKYLPYTLKVLKSHIEAQFEPWMNWDNRGRFIEDAWDDNDSATWTWQLDHIVPQSDLPYSSMMDENFQKCWALSNLRPLSAKQNFLDGVRRARHKNKT